MNLNKVFLRQLDIIKPQELEFPITVIGCGGLGSWIVLALAKLGCQDITVIDFDKVEAKNLPTQFYMPNQVGQFKARALAENIKLLTGLEITGSESTWEEHYEAFGRFSSQEVIICAVDSMTARSNIWHQLINDWYSRHHFSCYIDARMGGELLRILLVNPFDMKSVAHYQSKLYPESQVHHEPCTARAIAYNVFVCGGLVASLVKKYAKKEACKTDIIFDIARGETV